MSPLEATAARAPQDPPSGAPRGLRFVLAFDTAQAHCAAALATVEGAAGRAPLAIRVEPMAKGQAERLVPLLEQMLADAGLGWGDLAALGVGIGPGNFTGTRIAVAAARGLALGLGIPAVGISSFEAAALGRPLPCWALVPGPLGQVYAQRLAITPGEPLTLVEDDVERLEGDRIRLGDVAAETLVGNMARIAAERWRQPGLARPAPLYLRPADAAPPRDAPPRLIPG